MILVLIILVTIFTVPTTIKEITKSPILKNLIIVNNKQNSKENFDLSIDKLDISVSVIPNVDGDNTVDYENALKKGVAHFEGTGFPGEGKKIFIFGHSSTKVSSSLYGRVFENLNNLNLNDIISINYNKKD